MRPGFFLIGPLEGLATRSRAKPFLAELNSNPDASRAGVMKRKEVWLNRIGPDMRLARANVKPTTPIRRPTTPGFVTGCGFGLLLSRTTSKRVEMTLEGRTGP